MDVRTDGWTDGRKTDRQAGRQTDRQTDIMKLMDISFSKVQTMKRNNEMRKEIKL
jgi:hypothetical protein